jgi:6-phosphogluconolactonase
MGYNQLQKGRIHMGKKYIGYAGTYTRENSWGIYRFVLDTEAGTLETPEVAAEVGSPTYLAVSEDADRLYTVAQEGDMGGVHAYNIDAETGVLTMINGQLSEGAPPCHLEVQGGTLLTGNYHKGKVELLYVNEQGGVELGASAVHSGSGPHKRQEKPHVHFTGRTPDGKYIVVCDLGTDELVTYKEENGGLERMHTLKVKQGSGPRHIVFHPDGKTAYLLTELSSEVIVLAYEDGNFTEKQTVRAIPEDFTETNDASAIHISSDGKFVYTGNRGHKALHCSRSMGKAKS